MQLMLRSDSSDVSVCRCFLSEDKVQSKTACDCESQSEAVYSQGQSQAASSQPITPSTTRGGGSHTSREASPGPLTEVSTLSLAERSEQSAHAQPPLPGTTGAAQLTTENKRLIGETPYQVL